MKENLNNNIILDPKETIQNNVVRKKPILDREPQFFEGVPIPSWIELSIIDACNRSCVFCPKSDENIAPNTYNKMQDNLIDKLYKDLKKINFKGAFCLCGYGEPLLDKNINYIINKLGNLGGVEIITNGDPLTNKKLIDLYNTKATRVLISLYDGKAQIEKFNKMIYETRVPEDFVILRDRWYSDKDDYGVRLTNRTNTIDVGKQEDYNNFSNKDCYYPTYQTLIDWDGNIYLCPQDWQRKISMGNLMHQDFFDIWKNGVIDKYRKNLLNKKRCQNPCNKCNAEGTVYGSKHAKAWKDYYKSK